VVSMCVLLGMLRIAQPWNSDFLDNVEPVVWFQEPTWRDGTDMTPAPRCHLRAWAQGTATAIVPR
jgi:hypothetical protein